MSRKRVGGGLGAAQQGAKFVGVSVLAGAVLAGIALPAVGAIGLAAKGTVEGFDELPADLTRPPLSQKTVVLDADGGKIADIYARNRTVVPLDEIAPVMQEALIAIEDARFYEHGAIDVRGVARALNSNLDSGTTQGASTLTQQYVKNVFVEAAGDDTDLVAEATEKKIGRKIRELKYAIQLEEELGKDQILENYLNITFFGQQAYGVEAASQRYFSKSASELELHEAALLAGLVQSPTRYDPINAEEEAVKRRNMVLQRMVETKDITQEEADEAVGRELGLNVSQPRQGCITAVHDAGFFCDYVQREFLQNPVFGEDSAERKARWELGGLTIRTTLRPQAQKAASEAAKNGAHADDQATAAVVQVEPGTGHIISMAQSRPYGNDGDQFQTTLNLNTSGAMGGATYGFPPGSTFKPVTAAAALEAGVSPAKEYSSDYEMEIEESAFRNCDGTASGNALWELKNESQTMTGTWDMTDALGKSINTYFVMLMEESGLCETVTMADKLGIRKGADESPLNAYPSVTLGGQETTPLMMANAYATFANRGEHCEPVSIVGASDAFGNEYAVPETECQRVMSAENADLINAMLAGVVEDGTGQQVGLQGRQNAGKTGTTDERRDVWFVGYTPDVSTAVRVGGIDPFPMENFTLAGNWVEKAGGGSVAGPIWRQAMNGALEGIPASEFNKVDLPRGGGDDDDDNDGDGDNDSESDRGRPGNNSDNRGDRGRGPGGDGPGGNGPGGNGPGGNGPGDWDWNDWDWDDFEWD
ncbi:transglycosylase domain-containing protein [Streptomyces sp. SM12]|uniref:transglycosylase domain-containing protein n=1 Tax=Streptomyces sp. SM12 TaxID=1071602 RepID=UPI000CD53BB4|nr:transglycosylase domain-containing protein [Streptomyces sp. SM12]